MTTLPIPEPTLRRPAARPPRRRLRPFRILFGLLALCLVFLAGAAGYFYVSNTAFRDTVAGVAAGVNPRAAFGGRNAVTLMVLGKDEDRDDRAQVMKTRARSDTIILARLDFERKDIQLLSIPRDTRVRIPGTRGYHKINAAHSIGGPEKTAETLRDFLGVSPDASLVVDYRLLQSIIDQMGGVTVNVDKKMDYDDDWGHLHIHLKPGVQTLNGRNAMGFVRYRHANSGGGDSDLLRIARQQELLHGIKGSLKQPATWLRLPGVLEIVRKGMGGTLSWKQLVAVANFARTVPKGGLAMHVLPSRPGRTYVYPDRDAARALVSHLFPADQDARLFSDASASRRSRRALISLASN
jgi:LCP family protein required for cell wall assembly